MPVAPANTWAQTYDIKLKASYLTAVDAASSLASSQNFWRSWIFDNSKGLESTNPLFATKATFSQDTFNPLPFGAGDDLKAIADAWKAYMTAAVWDLVPPAPPFSVVFSVTTDPDGLETAYAALLAGFSAEGAIVPPSNDAGFAAKAASVAKLFRTATISAGALISGLDSGGTPAPATLAITTA